MRIRRTLIVFCVALSLTARETLSQERKTKSKDLAAELARIAKERQGIEKNIDAIERQIKDLERQLNSADEEEKNSLKALESLDYQIQLLREAIRQTELNQRKLSEQIAKTKRELEETQRELDAMKSAFARYAVGIYKFGVRRDLEILFSSGSFNQALARAEYIKRFQEAGKIKIRDIAQKKEAIAELQSELDARYAENEKLLEQRRLQAKTMEARRIEREKLIAKLRKDKRRLQSQIAQRQAKAKALQDAIQKMLLAEEEAIRRAREAKAKSSAERSEDATEPIAYSEIKGDFEKRKGKLPWPVQGGVIVRTFGENRNKDLKIVTFNNGVDISTSVGAAVLAVAQGVVSQIGFLPTFGNIVIVRHSNAYLTVYANLSEVKVAKGESVSAGQTIGVAGKAEQGGGLVHFEVWQGRNKHDPELWLAEK
ncbi:MAG: peptidoglycan DD-metalloendopeptidase family protein [Chloroherpetonaceae bacterium]|nr:peptidoglycan DD-metalloendopeptidase family protein [Chloroherpetonaceae bacterium]MDW8438249.1 peptidoglycan DD-metalloendopeptidase family protein [Chloroherpetonaceae bacterium]